LSKIILNDGELTRVIESQGGGKYLSQLQQNNRGMILDRNAELRKNRGALRPLSSMGLEYTIPLADYHTICKAIRRNNPGIGSKDFSLLLRKWLERYGQAYKVTG